MLASVTALLSPGCIVLVGMLLLTQGTACAASGESVVATEQVTPGGELTLLGTDPPTLDPALMNDTASRRYIGEIFSGLVTVNRQLQVVPDIAESWQITADGRAYTFKLRRGVRFHSGREVTARDFKYSFERAADPATDSLTADTYLGDIKGVKEKLSGQAKEIEGLTVADDYTLRIELHAPRYYFLAKMAFPTAFVVDRDNVESGRDWTARPVGTGPFKLVQWVKDKLLLLERNPDYHLEPARLDRVRFLLAANNPMALYENNEVDIVGLTGDSLERVQDPSSPLNRELVVGPRFDLFYVGFNTEVPPFDDMKVRQAFSHALDREKIAGVVLKGVVQRAEGIIPPGMPGHSGKAQGPTFDPERARLLLMESKYGGKLPPITLTIPGRSPRLDPVTEAILQQWRTNLGVEVNVQQAEFPVFLQDVKRNPLTGKKNEYGLYRFGWVAVYPDPHGIVDMLFHSKSFDNNGAYKNRRVDDLLDQARAVGDPERRFKLYQEAEQAIVDDAAVIPMFHSRRYELVKPRVRDYIPTPIVIPELRHIWLRRDSSTPQTSAAGSQVYFRRDSDLLTISTAGGEPTVVASDLSPAAGSSRWIGSTSPLPSPRRDKVAYVGMDEDLWVVAADGGVRKRLSDGPAMISSWSPDGSRVLYHRYCIDPAQDCPELGFHLVDVYSGATTKLDGLPNALFWLPEREAVVYKRDAAVREEGFHLYAFHVRTGIIHQLTFVPLTCLNFQPSVSPDGRWLLYSCGNPSTRDRALGRSELILAKIDNTAQTVLKSGWFGEFQFPVFSPAGSGFLYQQQRLRPGIPSFDVYLSRFGAGESKLFTSGTILGAEWLDENWVTIRRYTRSRRDSLHLIDVSAGRERLLAEDVSR